MRVPWMLLGIFLSFVISWFPVQNIIWTMTFVPDVTVRIPVQHNAFGAVVESAFRSNSSTLSTRRAFVSRIWHPSTTYIFSVFVGRAIKPSEMSTSRHYFMIISDCGPWSYTNRYMSASLIVIEYDSLGGLIHNILDLDHGNT